MLREIVFDTETTGLDAAKGDRLIELGCIEIVNRIPTGREFHRYLCPDREVHPDALAVHGLSNEFLQDKPRFPEVVDEFLEFIGDAPLVAHNGTFDLGFINAELQRVGRPALAGSRIIDTLALARRRHPAGPNTLDALCKRYGIDLSQRTKHGALLDSLLLAGVYVELLGERQATLVFAGNGAQAVARTAAGRAAQRPAPLPPLLTAEEETAHREFVKSLGAEPVWLQYLVEAAGGAAVSQVKSAS
jgi:DNA polymerase-3 subunit epsilon